AQFVENFRQTALSLPTADGAPSDQAHDVASAKAPVVAKEINGLAIFWSLVKSWFGGLLGKKV
ncbi:MAG: carbon monoxide dehydrogenase, partial [Betaproteobacteria bacterium]|nr:carbon monoxide dehydrogenase [Betaproteobacteria bacterium]